MLRSFTLTVLVLACPVIAEAATVREGFTIDGSLGLGVNRFAGDTDFGFQGLNIGVGAFLTNELALTLRWASSTNRQEVRVVDPDGEVERVDLDFGVQMVGPHVQYWLNDTLYIGAGAGLGIYGINPILDGLARSTDFDVEIDTEYGVGTSFRTGAVVWQRENAAVLFIGAEVLPVFFEGEVAVGGGVLAGFQVL